MCAASLIRYGFTHKTRTQTHKRFAGLPHSHIQTSSTRENENVPAFLLVFSSLTWLQSTGRLGCACSVSLIRTCVRSSLFPIRPLSHTVCYICNPIRDNRHDVVIALCLLKLPSRRHTGRVRGGSVVMLL